MRAILLTQDLCKGQFKLSACIKKLNITLADPFIFFYCRYNLTRLELPNINHTPSAITFAKMGKNELCFLGFHARIYIFSVNLITHHL